MVLAQPRAIVHTNRGKLEIALFAHEAPVTVESFLAMAKKGFFDGLLFHRVVPAFVAQAGCPRGDGWGGPGYTLPCEITDRTYQRGSLGMALAGKDTGGSQWFLCHRPTPHLDGRYTLFGQLEKGFEVLDALLPGDVILGVEIAE
jgi:cyclophilin family peptidyl-prolyl cis-trans isomerase